MLLFTLTSIYGILTIMNNTHSKRKIELANEVKTFITNITGMDETFVSNHTSNNGKSYPGDGFSFIESGSYLSNNRTIKNSIRRLDILFNVLCENGWEVDTEVEIYDLSIHLTKEHCFIVLSINRNGLYVYFEEI